MTLDTTTIRAVVFDYGNTLVPFSHEGVREMNEALAISLERHYGHVDREALDAVRAADRVRPYRREYRENDLGELAINWVRHLYGCDPDAEVLEDLLRVRYDAFQAAITLPEGVAPLLERLRRHRQLGVLSNYPDGDAVRESLDRLELRRFFDAVVVSGDVGWCKPHPRPFEAITEAMALEPASTLFVGDNWLADIQGAKRFGMSAMLITQYAPVEHFEPNEGDHEPDAVIDHLEQLGQVLGGL